MIFQSILILGAGYTGRALQALIAREAPGVVVHATTRQANALLRFDLHDASTWHALPTVDCTFWMFPAEPVALVEKFFNTVGTCLGKIIVIGTTGSFPVSAPHVWIDEASPLDTTQPRVQGEALIRARGGVAVYAAGIYGPGREPRNWLARGLATPSDKYLNVIHVDDLAQILWRAALVGRPGALYLAADGAPHPWNALAARWQPELPPGGEQIGGRVSKRVNPRATLEELDVTLRWQDVLVV